MPTRKIGELKDRPCADPDHYPPSMMVFEPGVYEHTCSSCGRVIQFRVSVPTMGNIVARSNEAWKDWNRDELTRELAPWPKGENR